MITGVHSFSIVLAGHGSRDKDGVREFEELVALMKTSTATPISTGYLEFAKPTITEAVQERIDSGSTSIVVVPALLAAATHAKNDMPSELLLLRESFPQANIKFAAPMDLHASLLDLCRRRIIEAESASQRIVARKDTCLVIVGRGTSDPDANGDVAKLCRMMEEGMGFGASFVCFSGTAAPLVSDGLKSAAKLGKTRIIVLPYLLFDGVLVKRIMAAADDLACDHPDLEVLKAGYLGVDNAIVDVLLERAREGWEGKANMNCSLCKYRVQIVGYERQKGAPQQSAHLLRRATEEAEASTDASSARKRVVHYVPHPIEAESFEIIKSSRDWSMFPEDLQPVIWRLVHTSGDTSAGDDLFASSGAVQIGIMALLRTRRIITDVTMVQSGFKQELLKTLQITTWCGVHDEETHQLAKAQGITRSAAGIRRAWNQFGNDAVLAIGDAPTAVAETVRLITECFWRPQLVVGLPVGFVGTAESKAALKRCLQVPRITNSGTRGGSPWAATVLNALMIQAVNQIADKEVSLSV
ncbi:MAG: precorrin-8X methylmutase [Candidatus Obscuribacterales bacterium]|nr:precorrin-8X methylmutase [Candidatus Obscuribacterales bacterium]